MTRRVAGSATRGKLTPWSSTESSLRTSSYLHPQQRVQSATGCWVCAWGSTSASRAIIEITSRGSFRRPANGRLWTAACNLTERETCLERMESASAPRDVRCVRRKDHNTASAKGEGQRNHLQKVHHIERQVKRTRGHPKASCMPLFVKAERSCGEVRGWVRSRSMRGCQTCARANTRKAPVLEKCYAPTLLLPAYTHFPPTRIPSRLCTQNLW
jgi:hypothetical protein